MTLSLTFGCTDAPASFGEGAGGDGGEEAGEEAGTMGESEGDAQDMSPVWPEESLGSYHLDSGIPIGMPGEYLFGHFENIELRRDGLLVTRLWCNGTMETEHHAVSFEGDEVYVYPEKGETAVMWDGVPVAEALVFRLGDSCEMLRTELMEPLSPYGEPGEAWTWRRGEVYLSTSYGEDGDLSCGADRLPNVPTECPDPG
ncbi:hypothetical protein [Paraliomyxa miuraensis]|uniref:hypothetical protein n=1 Tax=Paraliomyxa miuraensis TaxID=376150 RepID=UPI002252E9CD|nr:hypothetical protein [Paraliomyxa miuraensis]MCX4247861.1 hypothetical protein [Paraliomyxa miuraensis]